jgi:glycosyltransferase involved in cell wall biosynthesis
VLERLAEKASASAAVIPRSFCNGKQTDPSLTIYIPTFKRPELAALLDSLAPQLVPEVEVIVSDNDGSAGPLVRERLKNAPCRVDYSRRESNIGGDANILRGFSQGSGEWIWIVGDDDVLASDAISRVLSALGDMHYGAQDRLILLSKSASKSAATAIGSLADIAKRDPALPIAATLITANVCRREAVDLATGMANVDTKYGHAWAMPSRKVAVLPHPAIERVGYLHAGQGIPEGWDGEAVKAAYLRSVGIEPKAANFKWNYMSVEAK